MDESKLRCACFEHAASTLLNCIVNFLCWRFEHAASTLHCETDTAILGLSVAARTMQFTFNGCCPCPLKLLDAVHALCSLQAPTSIVVQTCEACFERVVVIHCGAFPAQFRALPSCSFMGSARHAHCALRHLLLLAKRNPSGSFTFYWL